MSYPSSIKRHRKKQSDTGFVYSTRDRTELSRRTFPAVTAEGDFDLYWIDGSETPEGQVLPDEMCSDTQQLCEIHRGVTGGPDAAIVYGLSYLLDAGYDYIGLLENDVLLAAGWYAVLKRLFSLGKRDGLRVGAATVRTYDKRSLWHHHGYNVLFGAGAGMVLFSRNAAECILNCYRTTTFGEVRQGFSDATGLDVAGRWEITGGKKRGQHLMLTSADWNFELSLIRHGLATLGSAPGLAENIDADMGKLLGVRVVGGRSQTEPDSQGPDIALACSAAEPNPADLRPGLDAIYQFDEVTRQWIVYPHQIAALLPGAFSKGWAHQWDQHLGPFSLRALNAGATLELPVTGAACVVLSGKPAMYRIRKRGFARRTMLERYRHVKHASPGFGAWTLTHSAAEAGECLKAVTFDRPQPWMRRAPNFRFQHIRPFIEAGLPMISSS